MSKMLWQVFWLLLVGAVGAVCGFAALALCLAYYVSGLTDLLTTAQWLMRALYVLLAVAIWLAVLIKRDKSS